jgi:cell division septation protein DedD
VSFEKSTDTVDVLRRGEPSSGVLEPNPRDTLYSVQIGAFRDLGNASSAEVRAQERFAHPVLRYHDAAGLFHIRVGRFSTRRAAESLRSEMQTTYPRDYHDCWVVQITEAE